jgi:osmotically-inducible protein OsmY
VSSAGSAGGASEASDAKIKEDLLAKIKADPVLSKEKIEVEVKDGQITLTGEVSTGAVKIQAEDLARSIAEGQMVNAERLMTKE